MYFTIFRMLFVAAASVLFAPAGYAYSTLPEAVHQKQDIPLFKILGHADLNVTRIQEFEEAGFSFHGGGIGVFKFSHFIGLHLGAQYHEVMASEDGIDGSGSYVDIPFGLTISYGNGFQGSTNYVNIGGFYGLPVSEFEFSGDLRENIGRETELKNMLGFHFDTYSVWPVNQKLGIGVHTFFKFGLKDLYEIAGRPEITSKYYSVGLGVSASFL